MRTQLPHGKGHSSPQFSAHFCTFLWHGRPSLQLLGSCDVLSSVIARVSILFYWISLRSVALILYLVEVWGILWIYLCIVVTSAKDVMFSSLFFSFYVCLLATLRKTSERICVKFLGKAGNGPMNKWLNLGGNLDQESGYGSVSRSVSRHW